MKRVESLQQPISNITLSLYNVEAVRKFSFGTWTSRQHIFVSLSAAGCTGWGENIISVNQPEISPSLWGDYLQAIKGLPLAEALQVVRAHREIWPDRVTELAEMALIDLAGKLLDVPARELLNLSGTEPVPGVFVILSDDIPFVEEQTRRAVASKMATHIKVKLFGDLALDRAVIRGVRKYAPRPDTYLIGDVNGGYRMQEDNTRHEELVHAMQCLYKEGLDACEDPAYIDNPQWVALQKECQPLSLIPDYPMRPATQALTTLLPGMGNIYNIHPGCTGSILDAIALGDHCKHTLKGTLMIGDDSLIGPGCTIWQQIAIGLSADWVEAVEKEEDSQFYRQAVRSLATDSTKNPIALQNESSGFGITLDETVLYAQAKEVLVV